MAEKSAKTRVLMLIPLYGGASYEWFKSFVKLSFALERGGSCAVDVFVSDNQPLASARNDLLRLAEKYAQELEENSERLDCVFFLDSDNTIEPQGALQLIKDATEGCGAASALYFLRKPPHRPVILNRSKEGGWHWADNYEKERLFEADGIGMGCCAIKWSAAKKMLETHPMPFEYRQVLGKDGKATYLTEDLVFCERLRAGGFSIFLDSRVKSGHCGKVVWESDFKPVRQSVAGH